MRGLAEMHGDGIARFLHQRPSQVTLSPSQCQLSRGMHADVATCPAAPVWHTGAFAEWVVLTARLHRSRTPLSACSIGGHPLRIVSAGCRRFAAARSPSLPPCHCEFVAAPRALPLLRSRMCRTSRRDAASRCLDLTLSSVLSPQSNKTEGSSPMLLPDLGCGRCEAAVQQQISTMWWMFDIGQYSNTNSPAKHFKAGPFRSDRSCSCAPLRPLCDRAFADKPRAPTAV